MTTNTNGQTSALTRTTLLWEFPHLTPAQLDWLWETFRGTRGPVNAEIRKAAKDARSMPVGD